MISNANREQSLLLAPLNHQLPMLSFRVKSMDWLELGHSSHHHAQINSDGTAYRL
jgi:hypothetical protein